MTIRKKDKDLDLSPSTITHASAMAKITEELNKLKKISTTAFKTGGKLDGFNTSIHESTNIEELISAYTSVKRRTEQYNEDAKDLGISSFPVKKFNGYTVEDWKHDIKLRIAIISTESRRKKLEQIQNEMREFMTREEKMAATMAKIERLGDGYELED